MNNETCKLWKKAFDAVTDFTRCASEIKTDKKAYLAAHPTAWDLDEAPAKESDYCGDPSEPNCHEEVNTGRLPSGEAFTI